MRVAGADFSDAELDCLWSSTRIDTAQLPGVWKQSFQPPHLAADFGGLHMQGKSDAAQASEVGRYD